MNEQAGYGGRKRPWAMGHGWPNIRKAVESLPYSFMARPAAGDRERGGERRAKIPKRRPSESQTRSSRYNQRY